MRSGKTSGCMASWSELCMHCFFVGLLLFVSLWKCEVHTVSASMILLYRRASWTALRGLSEKSSILMGAMWSAKLRSRSSIIVPHQIEFDSELMNPKTHVRTWASQGREQARVKWEPNASQMRAIRESNESQIKRAFISPKRLEGGFSVSECFWIFSDLFRSFRIFPNEHR